MSARSQEEGNMLDPETRRRLSQFSFERFAQTSGNASYELPNEPCTLSIDQVLPGRVHTTPFGTLYVSSRQVKDLHPAGVDMVAEGASLVLADGSEASRVVFLDIETCGLSSAPVFLIGTMGVQGGNGRVEQFFARDYSEEAPMLAHLADSLSDEDVLVTFNGRTFDIPFLRDRMTYHRLRYSFSQEHIDLLPAARRHWRGKLPDCKLQTLEAHICGRRRIGDTPGSLIPQLYHDFVRTGNAEPLEGVFLHNALDLITMAELIVTTPETLLPNLESRPTGSSTEPGV